MDMRVNICSIIRCCFFVLGFAVQANADSEFTFSVGAIPATLVLNDHDLLGSTSRGGFYLRTFDGYEYTESLMGYASSSNDCITVSQSEGSLPSFTFRIDTYTRHASIHMIDTEGVGESNRCYGIRFRLYGSDVVGLKSLDDVAMASTNWDSDWLTIYWKYPWGEEVDGTKGGVALYDGSLEGDDLDECLASIWINESLPQPADQDSWTEEDVLAWVDDYQAKLGDMSQAQFEASNIEDLYELTDTVAISAGVKRVYLHTTTWRGEYWPDEYSITHVNTNVFANGKEDLIAYTEYLAEHGMMIRLHNVAFPVGESDPEYIGETLDRRLDCWGGGTLETAISASDTSIYLRVNDGVELPIHVDDEIHYDYVRVGEEVVKAGSIERTEEEVWVLKDCTRGCGGTDAMAHDAEEGWGGWYSPWGGGSYIPPYDLDQSDSLMDELGLRYATFLNDVNAAAGTGHLHIDGADSHDITPWSARDLYDRVYSYLNTPVSSSRVGSSIAANFEQSFSAVRDDMTYNYFPLTVGIRLDEYRDDGYPATSVLNTHFMVQESIMMDGRRVNLSVPMSGASFGVDELNGHGLVDDVLELFGYWIELAPILDDEDVEYISEVTTQMSTSQHYETRYVLVLGKNDDGEYIFTPHHVMSRTTIDDGTFYLVHQEKGGLEPMQSITAGTSIDVNNPYEDQELQFVIRVHEDASGSLVDPCVDIADAGSLSITGSIDPGEFFQYTGGTTAKICDKNWNTLSEPTVTKSDFNVVEGTNTISLTHSGTAVDIETQYIVTDDAYVLKTNDTLGEM